MSADRPLATRYKEPVFPERFWSPTVGQVIAYINLAEGVILNDDLLVSLDKNPTLILPKPSEHFRNYNELKNPQHRKVVGSAALRGLELNILHSPSPALTEDEELNRRSVLARAVIEIGLEMLTK